MSFSFPFFFLKYLNEPNYEGVIAIQIGIMEQTISVIDKVSLKPINYYKANSCNVAVMNADRN